MTIKRKMEFLFFSASLVLMALIFIWDWHTPSGLIVWMFYAVPLCLSLRMSLVLALVNQCLVTALVLLALFKPMPSLLSIQFVLYNRVLGVFAGWLLTASLLHIRRLRDIMEASNASFLRLIDKNPDGVLVLDKKGKVLFVNSTLQSVSGLKTKDLVGQMLGVPLVHAESQEVQVDFRSQKKRTAELRVFSSQWQGQEADILFLRDITERKQAEQILQRDKKTLERLVEERTRQTLQMQEKAEKAKRLSDIGTLAATIAHELRNPLAAISLASANIRHKIRNHRLDVHFDNIRKKINDSDKIINNLLFYSKLRPPHFEPFALNTMLEEYLETVQKQASKLLTIQKELSETRDLAIDADPLQMRELFLNIFNNAVDAVPEQGGQIRVRTAADKDIVEICIKDNGGGIEKDVLEKVFEPFFSTKTKGTGLGLAVCKQITDFHKGSIHIDSEPGKGTQVRIRLLKSAGHGESDDRGKGMDPGQR